jgi:hypothetical protein
MNIQSYIHVPFQILLEYKMNNKCVNIGAYAYTHPSIEKYIYMNIRIYTSRIFRYVFCGIFTEIFIFRHTDSDSRTVSDSSSELEGE